MVLKTAGRFLRMRFRQFHCLPGLKACGGKNPGRFGNFIGMVNLEIWAFCETGCRGQKRMTTQGDFADRG